MVIKSELQEMSLEELWELFPIVLVPHDPQWIQWANEEMEHLSSLLHQYTPVINHIGSTAISDIQAKPIVDILVEISHEHEWRPIKAILERSGYICMSESSLRLSFNKGYTPAGYAERVFHIHFNRTGDNDEIIFRNYLIEYPDAAKDYETLKLSLLPKFRNNRDGYTAAKSDFVRGIVSKAKKSGMTSK